MTTSALYFPYIEVPDGAWTTRAILYWDRLTSIVPMRHDRDRGEMSPRMRQLMAADLVRAVVPGMVLGSARKFGSSFIEAMQARRESRIDLRRGELSDTTRIHAEKLNDISAYLVDEGLAIDRRNGWFDVDTAVAIEFMAYLAAVVGALPEVDAAPITDDIRSAKALGYVPSAGRRFGGPRRDAQEMLLRHLLPLPHGEPDIDELVAFKARHGKLLPELRQQIEEHCIVIGAQPDADARIAQTRIVIRDIKGRTDQIAANMETSYGDVYLSAFTTLTGAGITLAGDSGASAVAGVATSLVGPAYTAISSIRESRKAARKPLAYFEHAQRAFGAQRVD